MSIWSKPAAGIVKVNVKGYFLRSEMRASVGGGIMRDSNWIQGCKMMIGLVVPVNRKLRWYCLKMTWEKGNLSMIVKCENGEAVIRCWTLTKTMTCLIWCAWSFRSCLHAIYAHGGLQNFVVAPPSIRGSCMQTRWHNSYTCVFSIHGLSHVLSEFLSKKMAFI